MAHDTHIYGEVDQGAERAVYPKVKRIYVAGEVRDWKVGTFEKRSGRKVHGVKIDYQQGRGRYGRGRATCAHRGGTSYDVSPAKVPESRSRFAKIVEVPTAAKNIHFHQGKLPRKYVHAIQKRR